MCLAIPMQIIEINDTMSRCHAGGIERQVSLFMLQNENIRVGDFVMVHVGYAIQKVEEQIARTAWELHEQMSELNEPS
ncbi:MAG: HypC/HybG/HupF family hydrogenase formation chaperone [Gammaproteobacteria bacterium]|nr:HypC/HybG/HupF family hydrogenase formation chaperone [Gammaproteobacteria bacterium]